MTDAADVVGVVWIGWAGVFDRISIKSINPHWHKIYQPSLA